ncbi:MAG: hypothetical protein FJ104_15255 [Deltaproteobacteria bacterium]|nr:hypothetical protein [Deltaproteobacteria bacterium]
MPQFTEFPLLPKGEFKAAVDALIQLCRKFPREGEGLKELRARLKANGMYTRERVAALHRFLRLPQSDLVPPSPLVLAIAAAPDDAGARKVLADRLWQVNPVLFKCVIEQVKERVHSPNEILKYVDSFAYPGARLTGPQVTSWIQFAQGLEVFKPVGIRLGLDKLGEKFLAQADALDLDEFFDEDRDEPEPSGPAAPEPAEVSPAPTRPEAVAFAPIPAPAALPSTSAPPARPAPVAAPSPRRPSGLPTPVGHARSVPATRFATAGTFADPVLAETSARLESWSRSAAVTAPASGVEHFGVDAEAWNEDAERCLFRLAVASTLALRLSPEAAAAAWDGLAGVLDALYDGSAPEDLTPAADAQALLWTSLLARRFAELPSLAADLEREATAAGVFGRLDLALGRGLLGLELLWMLRALDAAGIVRREGLTDFTALPERAVRDTLFRLGYLTTPYAPDGSTLAAASAAVRRAAGTGPDAEARLLAFAEAAGCAYGCAERRRCDFACRERAGG